jgi:DNA-binding response OmpR family regulator
MDVLIVENTPELGALWAKTLARQGIDAVVVTDEDAAIAHLHAQQPDVIVADLDLPGAGAMAVADYAAYRHPTTPVVFVTASSFFSDGSIFSHSPNACAFLPARTPPEDLAAVVEFHGRRKAAGTG